MSVCCGSVNDNSAVYNNMYNMITFSEKSSKRKKTIKLCFNKF